MSCRILSSLWDARVSGNIVIFFLASFKHLMIEVYTLHARHAFFFKQSLCIGIWRLDGPVTLSIPIWLNGRCWVFATKNLKKNKHLLFVINSLCLDFDTSPRIIFSHSSLPFQPFRLDDAGLGEDKGASVPRWPRCESWRVERRDCQTVATRDGCLGDLRKKMSGQVIFNMLVEHGVDTVFGYSGGKSSQRMWDLWSCWVSWQGREDLRDVSEKVAS